MLKSKLPAPATKPGGPAPRDVPVGAWVAVQYAPHVRGILAVLFAGVVALVHTCSGPAAGAADHEAVPQSKVEGLPPPAKSGS
jgi:hypothetical protein